MLAVKQGALKLQAVQLRPLKAFHATTLSRTRSQ
ncbi:hypothetical protein SAMN05216315_10148 [Nitrosospira sp. Nsp18]|nr:hypothetical protein SAMN05216315_10148 [Nitrosospira sp. Nsp18]